MTSGLGPPGSVDLGPVVELSRYGLHAAPFTSSTDPGTLWRGGPQREILARLRAGVLDDAGVLLLLGDVGTGKSMLARALVEDLGPRALTATVLYPKLDLLDFLRVIGSAWRFEGRLSSREDFYEHLGPFLEAAAAREKRVLLVVDEVQSLSPELVTEIGTLASFAADTGAARARLNILLVGQEEVGELLARPEHAALRREVSVTCVTQPFNGAEVAAYVEHHLRLAGAERAVFTSAALQEIAAASGGTPRLINMICDLALVTGARRNADPIDADVVRECEPRLGLSRRKLPRAPRQASGRRTLRPVLVAGVLLPVVAIAGYLVGSRQGGDPVRPLAGVAVKSGEVAPPPPAVPAPPSAGPARPEGGGGGTDPVARPEGAARPADPPARPPAPSLRPPEPVARPAEPVARPPAPAKGSEASPASARPEPGAPPPRVSSSAPPAAPPPRVEPRIPATPPAAAAPAPEPRPAPAAPIAPAVAQSAVEPRSPAPVPTLVQPPPPPPTRPGTPSQRPASAPVADSGTGRGEQPVPARPVPAARAPEDAAPARGATPPSREVQRAREDEAATDPSAIIDWVLNTYPARRD